MHRYQSAVAALFVFAALGAGCAGEGPGTPQGVVFVSLGPSKAAAKVDLAEGRVLAQYTLSGEPHGLTVTPDGRYLFAADLIQGDALEVVDTEQSAVIKRLSVGSSSHHLAISPDGRWACATLTSADRAVLVDVAALSVVATIDTGDAADYVVFSPDGKHAYVSNTESETISVIDVAQQKVARQIPAAGAPGHLAAAPDGSRLYVILAETSSVAAIDVAAGKVVGSVRTGVAPHGLGIAANGSHVYVSAFREGQGIIAQVRTSDMQVVRTAVIGDEAEHVEVTPDGRWVVVTQPTLGRLVVLDSGALAEAATIEVGKEPHQMAFAGALWRTLDR